MCATGRCRWGWTGGRRSSWGVIRRCRTRRRRILRRGGGGGGGGGGGAREWVGAPGWGDGGGAFLGGGGGGAGGRGGGGFDAFVATPIKSDEPASPVLGVMLAEYATGAKAQAHSALASEVARLSARS